jgi:hypothetical protein
VLGARGLSGAPPLSSLLYISTERNLGSRVIYLDGTIALGRANARQTDQVGERHGRSLSRHRRCWRKRLDRDGDSYRLYVRGRPNARLFAEDPIAL